MSFGIESPDITHDVSSSEEAPTSSWLAMTWFMPSSARSVWYSSSCSMDTALGFSAGVTINACPPVALNRVTAPAARTAYRLCKRFLDCWTRVAVFKP